MKTTKTTNGLKSMKKIDKQMAALSKMIDEGFTFAAAVQLFSMKRTEYEKKLVKLAQKQAVEGELEVDDNACISHAEGEPGGYVMAWLWVPLDEDED